MPLLENYISNGTTLPLSQYKEQIKKNFQKGEFQLQNILKVLKGEHKVVAFYP